MTSRIIFTTAPLPCGEHVEFRVLQTVNGVERIDVLRHGDWHAPTLIEAQAIEQARDSWDDVLASPPPAAAIFMLPVEDAP